MHQHPRPAPKSASPANAPQTNPMRTNNQREETFAQSQSSQELRGDTERDSSSRDGGSEGGRPDGASAASNTEMDRLNLIVQVHIYTRSWESFAYGKLTRRYSISFPRRRLLYSRLVWAFRLHTPRTMKSGLTSG